MCRVGGEEGGCDAVCVCVCVCAGWEEGRVDVMLCVCAGWEERGREEWEWQQDQQTFSGVA